MHAAGSGAQAPCRPELTCHPRGSLLSRAGRAPVPKAQLTHRTCHFPPALHRVLWPVLPTGTGIPRAVPPDCLAPVSG